MESRILFSADAALLTMGTAESPAQSLQHSIPGYQSAAVFIPAADISGNSGQQNQRNEILFIDGAVADAQALAQQLRERPGENRSLQVVVLDASQDGVAQISAALAGQQNIDAMHIISHGADGALQLGATELNGSTLTANAFAISGWGEAMAKGADILLYGCDVAQTLAGQQFVDAIGRLTGADMEASSNLTGSTLLNGDWSLEYRSGQIETALAPDSALQSSFSSILAIHTVTTNADSGTGSLREAINNSNANGGGDLIYFDIGAAVITLSSALPTITGQVIIDGRTATGYIDAPRIEINGNSIAAAGLSFSGGSAGSAVYGLAIVNFGGNGIELLSGADGIAIESNYIGLRADGSTALGNGEAGISIDTSDNTIGGSTAASRNVISSNGTDGVIFNTGTGNAIMGNYIGTNAAGTLARGNLHAGIALNGGADYIVGGTGAQSGNLISGNSRDGIFIHGIDKLLIQGNAIGTNADRTAIIGNGSMGIAIAGGTRVTVGGTVAGAGNVIAGSGYAGVYLAQNVSGVAILSNAIHGNAALGIELDTPYGVTPNDPGDGDSGANNQQNYPVISAAAGNRSATIVDGSFNSHALRSYRLEFFASTVDDGSGHGEGQVYLGFIEVNTDASGNATFHGSVGGLTAQGQWISATATDLSTNDTSEFARNVRATVLNAAPQGTSATVTTLESTSHTFLPADFGFTDPQNFTANNFVAVTLTTLPATGVMQFNGAPVTAGQTIQQADLALGRLVYTPADKVNGTAVASFSFRVSDDGGSGNGSLDTDFTARVLNIDITPVNDAPQGSSGTVHTLKDAAHTFSAAEFGFSDPVDNQANNFHSLIVCTIPASGILSYRNVPLSAGSIVLKADIDLGMLVFTPDAGSSASFARFDFQVRDDGGTMNGGADTDPLARTMSIAIAGFNHAPAGASHTVSMLENTAYTFTANDFSFSDEGDVPANGFLAVVVTTIPATGVLRFAGAALAAGTVISKMDIDNGRLVYTPPANASGSALAAFTFRVRDDGGSLRGNDTDPVARFMTLDIRSVNDAPVGASSRVLAIATQPVVFTTADFSFADPSDSPANDFLALIVTSLPASGVLSNRGVPLVVGSVVPRSDIDAGLLRYDASTAGGGRLRVSFAFQVRDNGGVEHGGIDTDPVGRTMTIEVMRGAEVGAAPADEAPDHFLAGIGRGSEQTADGFRGQTELARQFSRDRAATQLMPVTAGWRGLQELAPRENGPDGMSETDVDTIVKPALRNEDKPDIEGHFDLRHGVLQTQEVVERAMSNEAADAVSTISVPIDGFPVTARSALAEVQPDRNSHGAADAAAVPATSDNSVSPTESWPPAVHIAIGVTALCVAWLAWRNPSISSPVRSLLRGLIGPGQTAAGDGHPARARLERQKNRPRG